MFNVENASELGKALFIACISNNENKMAEFVELVGDLSVDWLQMIFQYYQADRKVKMQDYTPKSLARFMAKLANADDVIDMCAGSGALSIQAWNLNHETKFTLYEFDANVIPYLLFNMAVRNIECDVYHMDVLTQEVFKHYTIRKGDEFGIVKESNNI